MGKSMWSSRMHHITFGKCAGFSNLLAIAGGVATIGAHNPIYNFSGSFIRGKLTTIEDILVTIVRPGSM
jgi:hypothetical protein